MSWFSVLGSVAGSLFSSNSAKKQAQSQMNFQERMSNTAHQREVKDLRDAGLNPILSATGGQGASTPSGAMAQIQNPTQNLTNDVVTARRYREIEKNIAKADINVKDTTAAKNKSDIAVNDETIKTQQTSQLVNSSVAAANNQQVVESLERTKGYALERLYKGELIGLTNAQRDKVINEIREIDSKIALIGSQIELNATSSALNITNSIFNEARTRGQQWENLGLELSIPGKQNEARFDKNNENAPFIKRWLPPFLGGYNSKH